MALNTPPPLLTPRYVMSDVEDAEDLEEDCECKYRLEP